MTDYIFCQQHKPQDAIMTYYNVPSGVLLQIIKDFHFFVRSKICLSFAIIIIHSSLFGFDADRCRVLCLVGTQTWRDRRRGTDDNIVIVGSVQMFLLSTLPTHSYQGKNSSYPSITATVAMVHLSVKTFDSR